MRQRHLVISLPEKHRRWLSRQHSLTTCSPPASFTVSAPGCNADPVPTLAHPQAVYASY